MTKLEAWKKWCEEARITDPIDYTLKMSSHGQAFSAGWDAAFDKYAKIFDSYTKTTAQSKVERIAMWMNVNNYATGHGDTVEDLLKELEWQIAEREREEILKLSDALGWIPIEAVRARGET